MQAPFSGQWYKRLKGWSLQTGLFQCRSFLRNQRRLIVYLCEILPFPQLSSFHMWSCRSSASLQLFVITNITIPGTLDVTGLNFSTGVLKGTFKSLISREASSEGFKNPATIMGSFDLRALN
ncbi:hypothetical protein [Chitinophaga rhizophila]|uniref:Uncharacterized protein n=1 Tax=Chitinophaga rhizophila TaxID=2866212 RepID=A0ABS7GIU5_9BACT|nr:hypothetical protein [Chitinophaga rhizophila]MBW8687627.1 hypothetical protein [Chitinophaga rhizophila]